MKKLFYLLIIYFSISSNIYSQNYLNESSKWYTIRGDIFEYWFFTTKHQVTGDIALKFTKQLCPTTKNAQYFHDFGCFLYIYPIFASNQ